MAEEQQPKPTALEREARRLERIRNLRLVAQAPERVVEPADGEYEPDEAA